jgi:Lysozyme like domain
MTGYTYAQLEGLWIQAGGSTATAPIAAAIAEAESGGQSTAVNPTDNNGTQTSWGLWQISNGTHGQPVPNILDPGVNASAAVAKYQANGWQPWGTYTSGAYKAFLSSGTTPQTTGLPAASTASTAAAATYATTCLVGFPGISIPVIGDVGSFCMFSRSEARGLIGGVLLGVAGILGLAAMVILAASAFDRSGAASAVANSVAPVKAVVKTAKKVAPKSKPAPKPKPAAKTKTAAKPLWAALNGSLRCW